MFRLWRPRVLPPRPDGAPLRDGDTVPYEGFRRAAEIVTEELGLDRLPGWCVPTRPLPEVGSSARVRPYVRPRPRPTSHRGDG